MAEEINIQVIIDASKGAESLGELEGIVEDLNNGIKDSEKQIGNLNKKIGDLNKELSKTEKGSKEFKKISGEIKKTESEIKGLTSGIKALDSELSGSSKTALTLALNIDKSSATIGELEKSIEIINEELKNTDRGSEAFKNLSGELINANRELKNIELSLEALDTEQVASELGSVTGAVGDVTGAFILLGGEGNETLEAIGQRLNTAIGISVGVKGAIEGISSGTKLYKNFSKQLQKNNKFLKIQSVALTVLGAVTQAFAFITGAGTKALKFFRIALISTGIGALVVGIGLLIANFDKVLSFIKPLIDGLKSLGDFLGFTTFAIGDQIEASEKRIETLKKESEQIDKNIEKEKQRNAIRVKDIELSLKLAEGDFDKTEELEKKKTEQIIKGIEAEKKAFLEKKAIRLEELQEKDNVLRLKAKAERDSAFGSEADAKAFDKRRVKLAKSTNLLIKQIASENFLDIKELNQQARETQIDADKDEQDRIKANNKERRDEAKRRSDARKSRANEILSTDRKIQDLRLNNLKEGFDKEAKLIEISFERQREDALKNEKLTKDQRTELLKKLTETEFLTFQELRKQNIIETRKIEEEFFQDSLKTDSDRQARKLELEFKANRERIGALVQDDEKLKTLLKLNDEKFFRDLQTIEDNANNLSEKQRQNLVDKIKKDNQEIALLEKKAELQKLSERKKAGKEGLKLIDEINNIRVKKIETQKDIEINRLKEQFEEQKKLYIEQGKDLSLLTKQFATERELIEKTSSEQINQVNSEIASSDAELKQQTNDALQTLAFDTAQQVSDLAFEVAEENAQRESDMRLEKLDQSFNAEQDRLNQKVRDGLISQKEADRQSADLKKKSDKAKLQEQKKFFEEQKKRQISQAIVNGALAFTSALATTVPLVPLGLLAGAGVLVSTGVQIAKIKSTKFEKGGILSGASHSKGGIKTSVGELEGGEAVINKKSTKLFKGTLSQINEAGGGVRFASGGILGSKQAESTLQEGSNLGGILTSLNKTLSQPIKSFVVESEVSTVQNRVRNLERNSDL